MPRFSRRATILFGATSVVFAVGLGTFAVAADGPNGDCGESSRPKVPQNWDGTVPTGVNEYGESYGSTSASGKRADLVWAVGDGGVMGFVRWTEVEGPQTLADARTVRTSAPIESVPLYDSDGVAVLGTFTLTPACGSESSTSITP